MTIHLVENNIVTSCYVLMSVLPGTNYSRNVCKLHPYVTEETKILIRLYIYIYIAAALFYTCNVLEILCLFYVCG